MSEKSSYSFLEIIEFIIKRKELIIIIFFASFVLSYLGIFLLIEEQFESTALIIPREDDASSMAGGLLSSIKKMPFNLGTKATSIDIDLFKTIIYSRTVLEDVIRKFDLLKVYKLDTTNVECIEKAIKRLRSEVATKETEESAFIITVRANTRQRSADMTNYLISKMNERIIELKIRRSRENRMFLEERIKEISNQLKNSEDSLRFFQERTGLLDAKTQLQGILSTHVALENDLIAKKFQYEIYKKLYDKESPQVKELALQIEEFQKRLIKLRMENDQGSPILPLKILPKVSTNFLRLYREVEINNLLMEFVVPLYEQAKIEEKKDYPVLQVIDYAVPPAKKSYPPRILYSLIGAISITFIVMFFLFMKRISANLATSNWLSIMQELSKWKWK